VQHDPKIIILTAGYGTGHIQVSKTLQESFHRYGVDRVKIIDLFQEAHPGMNSISRYLYLYSPIFSAYGIDYYGWSYYMTRNVEMSSTLAKWFNLLGRKKMIGIMKEEKPDAIVCTFPFAGIREQLKSQGVTVPLFTVITDFSLHNRWLLTNSDRYYVATGDLKRDMVSQGVQPGRIAVSGIPIRERFYERKALQAHRDNNHSILVIAGAHGILPDIKLMTKNLLTIPGARVDIVCGKNEKLKKELESRFGQDSRLRLFGYVEALHDRMRHATCVITKAGGITLSEAIQIGTPILIFKPFPGQEKENARYLQSKGAASVSSSVRELVAHATELIASGGMRRRMAKLYETFAAGRAADMIVEDVLLTAGGRAARDEKVRFEHTGAL
jgi:processive 1,2-diacylglycerol beta-glucosyltransferase